MPPAKRQRADRPEVTLEPADWSQEDTRMDQLFHPINEHLSLLLTAILSISLLLLLFRAVIRIRELVKSPFAFALLVLESAFDILVVAICMFFIFGILSLLIYALRELLITLRLWNPLEVQHG
jgi:hypothetical protein